MDHPRPSLRYVKADDFPNKTFDGFAVEGQDGEKLGEVNGFIVDSSTRRPRYVVVDAGGWFKSKHVLVPVGHISMSGSRTLRADLTKDRIKRFPGADLDEFTRWTGDQLAQFDVDVAAICCDVERRPHDVIPVWWREEYYVIEPLRGARGADTREPSMAHDRRRAN